MKMTLTLLMAGLLAASQAPEAQSVECITIERAAARIKAATGPRVVVLYNTRCALSKAMFPTLVSLARGHRSSVTFLVYSVDREENASSVPAYLATAGAPFKPVYIETWAPGGLIRAIAPLGISVGMQWTTPLVAVLDRNGQVVVQGQG